MGIRDSSSPFFGTPPSFELPVDETLKLRLARSIIGQALAGVERPLAGVVHPLRGVEAPLLGALFWGVFVAASPSIISITSLFGSTAEAVPSLDSTWITVSCAIGNSSWIMNTTGRLTMQKRTGIYVRIFQVDSITMLKERLVMCLISV